MRLAPQAGVKVTGLDLGGDEIFLHPVEHVQVGGLVHVLLGDLALGVVKSFSQLLKARLYLENGAFSLGFLCLHGNDFLLDLLKLLLLGDDHLLGFVVLFLDLAKLGGDLTDLFLIVLESSGVVRGLEQGVALDELFGAVVNPNEKENKTFQLNVKPREQRPSLFIREKRAISNRF